MRADDLVGQLLKAVDERGDSVKEFRLRTEDHESRLSRQERTIATLTSRINQLEIENRDFQKNMLDLLKRKHGYTVRRVRNILAHELKVLRAEGRVAHSSRPKKKKK